MEVRLVLVGTVVVGLLAGLKVGPIVVGKLVEGAADVGFTEDGAIVGGFEGAVELGKLAQVNRSA